MARITVDDCLKMVDSPFDLVLLASERARNLEMGASDPLIEVENDKPTVIALREIADGFVNEANIKQLVRNPEEALSHLSEEQ